VKHARRGGVVVKLRQEVEIYRGDPLCPWTGALFVFKLRSNSKNQEKRRFTNCRRKIEMSLGVQSRDDTRVPDGHEEERLGLHLGRGVEQRILIAALDRD
jgi:hypothetical protein